MSRPRHLVTGGAGFIGSNLVDRLIARGIEVVVYDDLSTGLAEFLDDARKTGGLVFVEGDLLDASALERATAGCDHVWHLAANADVRFGTEHPRKDLEQNTIATFHVLEAMRATGVRRMTFASTGSIYGEPDVFPTPENAPFPLQTSLYGASKLACEGLISAYCEGFGFQSWVFRFVSVLGDRYTHGHVFDFYRKLREDPTRLYVLGNGQQRKSYMSVQDCIDGMFLAVEHAREKVNVLNLGANEYCKVNDSIGWIAAHLGLSPTIEYAGGERGWIGDSPFIWLDASKMRQLGWQPRGTIQEGVIRTLDWLRANDWVLERRQ